MKAARPCFWIVSNQYGLAWRSSRHASGALVVSCWSGEAMVHLSVRETNVDASRTRTKCSCGTSHRQQAGEEGKYMHVNNCNLQSSLRVAAGMQAIVMRKRAGRSVWERREHSSSSNRVYITHGMISTCVLLGSHGGQTEGANRQRWIAAVTFQRLHHPLPGD